MGLFEKTLRWTLGVSSVHLLIKSPSYTLCLVSLSVNSSCGVYVSPKVSLRVSPCYQGLTLTKARSDLQSV